MVEWIWNRVHRQRLAAFPCWMRAVDLLSSSSDMMGCLWMILTFALLRTAHAKKANFDERDALSFFGTDSQAFFQADESGGSSLMGGQAAAVTAQQQQQKCVPIPQNMSLCRGIGYEEMLIPNLLNHETLREAMEESAHWQPLANIKCHQHTRLFLCSLLAPLCPMQQQSNIPSLDGLPPASVNEQMTMLSATPPVNIYPCRSLCEAVQASCEGVMQKHGFPWPDILACSRFPVDNDMCITPYASGGSAVTGEVEAMSTVPTTTVTTITMRTRKTATSRPVNSKWTHRTRTPKPSTLPALPTTTISTTTAAAVQTCAACNSVLHPGQLDALFCQADFVGKVRFRRMTRRGVFLAKRPKLLKVTHSHDVFNLSTTDFSTAKSVEFVFDDEQSAECRQKCMGSLELKSQLYLLIGKFQPRPVSAHTRKSHLPLVQMQLVLPWFAGPNNRDFRQTEKRLQNLKCGSGQKAGKKEGRTNRKLVDVASRV